jgi:hypothetical protein
VLVSLDWTRSSWRRHCMRWSLCRWEVLWWKSPLSPKICPDLRSASNIHEWSTASFTVSSCLRLRRTKQSWREWMKSKLWIKLSLTETERRLKLFLVLLWTLFIKGTIVESDLSFELSIIGGLSQELTIPCHNVGVDCYH